MATRFVILHHQATGGEHWDLMLERSGHLLTWQLLQEPAGRSSLPIPARRIGDHRKAYLDYEGPISGDRGHVRRVDEGTVEFDEATPGRYVVLLRGGRLSGRFTLTADGDAWVFDNIRSCVMIRDEYPYYLANKPAQPNADLVVTNKYTGEAACRVALADSEAIDTAIGAAVKAFDQTRKMPGFKRQAVLDHVVTRVTQRHEELAGVLCIETGKPIRDARGEVTRLIDTFRVAAEESVRLTGEYLPLDISRRAEGYEGVWRRFPIGPCSFISPFNFPLNLVAHKVAPAIAVGCPFILKPASWTPIGALILGEILAETDLPEGAFSILPCSRHGADLFTTDERLKLLSFTGSPEVGWALKARAGKKKVVLELGGNAACVVDEGVDLEFAADRIIVGAFYQSGQSCISVQRIIAHDIVYEHLKQLLVDRIAKLKAGDPLEEDTFLGPMISLNDAKRIEQWVNEAVDGGAKVVCGGRRNGVFYDATLLENVEPHMKISCIEAFGPVATMQAFVDFKEAVRIVNDSVYGLQAGIFTKNIDRAFYAFNELQVGGVVINDVPSFRVDNMPYGGVKDSGLGREGVRFAMEDMTELRLLVLNKVGRC